MILLPLLDPYFYYIFDIKCPKGRIATKILNTLDIESIFHLYPYPQGNSCFEIILNLTWTV
jgi:hypothetical protein